MSKRSSTEKPEEDTGAERAEAPVQSKKPKQQRVLYLRLLQNKHVNGKLLKAGTVVEMPWDQAKKELAVTSGVYESVDKPK